MLHIILLVLKIIGIGLLCLIGLLLLLIALVLFVPVRYRFSGSYLEKVPKLSGRITWLGHAVSARIFFDGGQKKDQSRILVKICGIKIFDTAKPAASKEAPVSEEKEVPVSKKKEAPVSEEKTAKEDKKAADEVKPVKAMKAEAKADGTAACEEKNVRQTKNDKTANEAKIVEHTKNRKGLLKKLKAIPEKITERIQAIGKKLETIGEKKDKLMAILCSEENKKAFVLLKRSAFKLIKHILPRRIWGRIHFGMDDPEKTGRILGGLAVFYPLYAKQLCIAPDFEKKVFEAELSMTGKIQAFTFLSTGIKIVLNKDLRRIVSELKHL